MMREVAGVSLGFFTPFNSRRLGRAVPEPQRWAAKQRDYHA